MEARYASYRDLADLIRQRFANPAATLRELYRRLIFNILIGNTDDHARNIAAFWDGKALTLTPAYDLCPQLRTGQEATQAMRLDGDEGNHSTLTNALSICAAFQLTPEDAHEIIDHLKNLVATEWQNVCDEAQITVVERKHLWQRAILSDYCLQGWD